MDDAMRLVDHGLRSGDEADLRFFNDWALNLSSSRLCGSLLSCESEGRPTEFPEAMLLDHIDMAGDITIDGAECVGLSAAGEDHRAWDVVALKCRCDGRRRWLLGPSRGGAVAHAGVLLYGLLFKHRLSPSRAPGFFVICISSGAIVFSLLDQHHILVVSRIPGATHFGGDSARFVSCAYASGSGTAQVRCGRTDNALQEATAVLRHSLAHG